MKYSIVLADSHVLFRDGLARLLEKNDEIKIVGQFSSGRECIDCINSNPTNLIISDIQLSDISYYELIDQVRSINNDCKIIILSESATSYDLSDIYDLNVDAFVYKKISFKSFNNILMDILNGNIYFDPDALPIVNKVLFSRSINIDLLNKLTRREKQMLVRVAEGMSNKEIAVDCNISERTVKNHLSSIFQKIEVSDRTQAAVFAIKTNLVQI